MPEGTPNPAQPATLPRPDEATKVEQLPPWNVVLLDDDEHTYDYVIRMLQELFAYTPQRAYVAAKEVDTKGRVICCTTHKERAELKQDQIHSFGKDPLMAISKGAMSAVLEPAQS